MKLATFKDEYSQRVGVVMDASEVADIAAVDPSIPEDMITFLEAGPGMLARAAVAAQTAPRMRIADIELQAPVSPRKLLALGINYRAHIAEMQARLPNFTAPKAQVWFNKQVTSVTGPGSPVHRPRVSQALDYEGELAVVIGTRCRHVPAEQAASVIAGYTICNDVSVRDWQMATPTQTMGKSFDTHAPLGPWIVTPDEIGDPQELRIRTWVNDDLRQDFMTSDMVFTCAQMIEHLSQAMTLEPGDVIATGTSIGNGALRMPPLYLVPGDEIRIEIERIGTLANFVVEEPEAWTFTR